MLFYWDFVQRDSDPHWRPRYQMDHSPVFEHDCLWLLSMPGWWQPSVHSTSCPKSAVVGSSSTATNNQENRHRKWMETIHCQHLNRWGAIHGVCLLSPSRSKSESTQVAIQQEASVERRVHWVCRSDLTISCCLHRKRKFQFPDAAMQWSIHEGEEPSQSIDTPPRYGWSVVCGEKPLFSLLCLLIDFSTGSSTAYYLKSISATLPRSIFHSTFSCHSVVLVLTMWTPAILNLN